MLVLVALQRLLMTLTFTFEQNIALTKGSGLLSTGSTVDEAGFLFGLLDRGCAIQIQYVKYIYSLALGLISRTFLIYHGSRSYY
jgi:hypothetical protein